MLVMLGSAALKFLSGLLALTLWGVTVMVVMNQTVLSSQYLEHQLSATNSYARLSSALAHEIAQTPELAAVPDAEPALQSILTPAVIKSKVNGAIEQLEAYNHGNGPQPTVDLSDLAAQAQAAGLPIGQNTTLTKPIVIGGDQASNTKSAGQVFGHVQIGTVIAMVILLLGVALLSWQQRRYTALPTVVIVVGAGLGVLALVLYFAVGMADHFIPFSSASNAFVSLEHDLAKTLTRDLGKRFGLIAAVYLAIGVSTRILAARLRPKRSKALVVGRE